MEDLKNWNWNAVSIIQLHKLIPIPHSVQELDEILLADDDSSCVVIHNNERQTDYTGRRRICYGGRGELKKLYIFHANLLLLRLQP